MTHETFKEKLNELIKLKSIELKPIELTDYVKKLDLTDYEIVFKKATKLYKFDYYYKSYKYGDETKIVKRQYNKLDCFDAMYNKNHLIGDILIPYIESIGISFKIPNEVIVTMNYEI